MLLSYADDNLYIKELFAGTPAKPERERTGYLKFCKGTQIVCPKCNHLCGTANRDIDSIEVISSSAWDGILWGSLMKCPKCGTYYYRDGKLHTQFGWKHQVQDLSIVEVEP